MRALFGIETEYAVLGPAAPEVLCDLLVERVGVTRGVGGVYAAPDDAGTAQRVLANGSRCYVDHAHPEYCTPEVTNLADLVAHDRAGELLLREAATELGAAGLPVRLFKNNTDGKGNSYGCHENYLLPRELDFAAIVAGFTGFLVSRTVLIGAGRVGVGPTNAEPGFQLAQRPDFFSVEVGLQTTIDRPLINTRDEPHADPRRWRRLHVITGDANRSQFATWLKVGTASLVLATIAAGRLRPLEFADPVGAFRTYSHDPNLQATARLKDGRELTAIDASRHYLEQCEALADVAEVLPEAEEVLAAWSEALDDLSADPGGLADRLDWVAKLRLLEGLRQRDGLAWSDPRLAALDLLYADLDDSRSPFAALERAGRFRSIVTPAEVAIAAGQPPADTRAYLRGRLVAEFGPAVVAPAWETVTLRGRDGRDRVLRMSEPAAFGARETAAVLNSAAGEIDALLRGLGL